MSSDPSPSLVSLFEQHRDGDPDATNAILSHCQDCFLRITRRMLRGFPVVRAQHETGDVFGEAVPRLLTALQNLSFDTPQDFLYLASHNIRLTLLDLSRRIRQPHKQDMGVDVPAGSTNDPVKLAMWDEFHTQVASAPPDEKQLFDLLYYQDMSLPAVSAMLNMPLSTLKLRWQNARVNLMLRLKNELPV